MSDSDSEPTPVDKKSKKRKAETEADVEAVDKKLITEGRVGIAVIASPLANEKLTKKALKLVKKASKAKAIRRGVKEVVKALRKGEKGVMIIAGNITPIDVITHIPILCEENNVPYVYVPAKEDLGTAGLTKRPTSCVLVQAKGESSTEYGDLYKKVYAECIKVAPHYEK